MGRLIFNWERSSRASPTYLTMSAIFDYEPEPRKFAWTHFKLVCPACGNDRFIPFPSLRKNCLRISCGLCSQDLMRPQLQSKALSECSDCNLTAECLGLPALKMYEFIINE